MKKANLLLIFVLLVMFTLPMCSDDDEDKVTIVGTWKITAQTVTYGGQTIDLYAEMEDCDKDDLTIIKDGGTFEYNEGATNCEGETPDVGTGTWALSADGKTLTMVEGGETTVSTVKELSLSTLVIEFTDAGMVATMTLTKQ